MRGYRKLGPLRKVVSILRHATDLYDSNRVRLECGHETNGNGLRAICSYCALTDGLWRRANVPRLIKKLEEMVAKREDDRVRYPKLKLHMTCDKSPCDMCKQINGLDKIISGVRK